MGVRKEIYAETREKNTRLQLSQVYIQVHTYKHINILFLGGIIAQRARLFFLRDLSSTAQTHAQKEITSIARTSRRPH